jgi:hypothetical protein
MGLNRTDCRQDPLVDTSEVGVHRIPNQEMSLVELWHLSEYRWRRDGSLLRVALYDTLHYSDNSYICAIILNRYVPSFTSFVAFS